MEKVSVIIPVYNKSSHLKECLDSVINQTYNNLEIIIINDHSTDDSLDIINSYNDKRIKLINHKTNKGSAVTRNDGIKAATGRFITFLDADDYWVLDKIEKQLDFITRNNYVFIYSDYTYYRNGKTHVAKVPKELNYNKLLKNTAIFICTVMLDMNYFNKEDIYMPDLKMGQDAAAWFKILKTGVIAYGMDESLAIYRVGEPSLSHNKFKAINRTWNLYKRENIGFIKRVYCFIGYALNAIIRRVL